MPDLIVMVKLPRPGRVKTRLARALGPVGAVWWYRHQVSRLLGRLEDRRWRLVLAVSPDAEGLNSRVWPAHLPRVPQGGGDIGARMARCLRRSSGPAVLIGSDIPAIGRAHVARAFRALGAADMVFGPALDGGFWLVGARHSRTLPRGVFRGVRWSGPHALADTLAGLGGVRVALVDRLADVDRAEDLQRGYCSQTGGCLPPGPPRIFRNQRSA